MKERGIRSYDALAELLGTKRQTVIGWTKYGRHPRSDYRAKLIELGVSENVFRQAGRRDEVGYDEILERLRRVEEALGLEPPEEPRSSAGGNPRREDE